MPPGIRNDRTMGSLDLTTRWRSLASILMLDRMETRRFLGIAAIDSFGNGLYTATSILFFTRVLGFSAARVGLAISVGSIAALVLTPVLGRLADHWGARTMMISLLIVRAGGYGLLALSRPYGLFFVLTCVVICADRATNPINLSLIGSVFPGRARATILGTMLSVRNGAIVLGSLTATLPVVLGQDWLYTVAILTNAASFLVAAALVRTLPRVAPEPPATPPPGTGELQGTTPVTAPEDVTALARPRSPLRDGRYLLVTVVNGVLFTHNTILTLVLPLWVINRTNAPAWVLTCLLTINAILAMTLQIPVNRRFAHGRGATRAGAAAGVAIAAACVLYAFSGHLGAAWIAATVLVVAILFHTLGECLHTAMTPLSFELAPPERRGQYLSVYSLGRAGQDVVGAALLLTALLHSNGPVWWLVGAVIVGVGLLPAVVLREPPALRPPIPQESDHASR